MCEFFDFVVAFDIDADIQSNVIGNSEFISIAIKYIFRIVEVILSDRIGHRSACLIGKVQRGAISSRKLVIGH